MIILIGVAFSYKLKINFLSSMKNRGFLSRKILPIQRIIDTIIVIALSCIFLQKLYYIINSKEAI